MVGKVWGEFIILHLVITYILSSTIKDNCYKILVNLVEKEQGAPVHNNYDVTFMSFDHFPHATCIFLREVLPLS